MAEFALRSCCSSGPSGLNHSSPGGETGLSTADSSVFVGGFRIWLCKGVYLGSVEVGRQKLESVVQ